MEEQERSPPQSLGMLVGETGRDVLSPLSHGICHYRFAGHHSASLWRVSFRTLFCTFSADRVRRLEKVWLLVAEIRQTSTKLQHDRQGRSCDGGRVEFLVQLADFIYVGVLFKNFLDELEQRSAACSFGNV